MRASLEILEEGGREALTVQAVVDRAGSSVGSFYARFRGKDDLLEYLGESVWHEAAERWDQAIASKDWRSLDLSQLAEGAARLLLEAERSHAAYLKELGLTVGGKDDAYDAFRARLLEGLEGLFVFRRDSIDHIDPVFAVRVALRALLGIVSAKEGPAWQPPRERVVQECRQVLLSYLQPAAAGPPESSLRGQMDFFDVWG